MSAPKAASVAPVDMASVLAKLRVFFKSNDITDAKHKLFAGTEITQGQCVGIVVFTGNSIIQ
jgi:magnesium-transporting ATPase (P-type)